MIFTVLAAATGVARAQRIYWTGEAGIRRAHLDGTNAEPVVTGAGGPFALALIEGKIYFPGRSPRRIQRANLDGSEIENVVTSNVDGVRAIALDLVDRKVYWINYWWINEWIDAMGVFRADLDNGSNVENVLFDAEFGFYGIALDPYAGKLYWTMYDRSFQGILRGPLDKFAPEQLITEGLGWPYGIALDLVGGKVYWADIGLGRISRANLDGSEPEPLLQHNGTVWNVALDVRRAKIYWTDSRNNAIFQANFDGSDPALLLYPAGPFGLAIDDRIFFDCDASGQVHLPDQRALAECLTGPGAATRIPCLCADENGDRDVDLQDFAAFQRVFGAD